MGRVFDFIANSGDGVFAVDRRQSVVLWNDRATGILGFTAEEVLGKKCYTIVCGRDARGCVVCCRGCAALTSARQLEADATTNLAVRTKTGAEAWLNLSTVVVSSRRRELSVLVHLFREVTSERQLLQAARDFAAVVSGQSLGQHGRRSLEVPLRTTPVELTPREREVLTCLASGASTDAAAASLGISPHTVRNHVNNILGKLDVHSRLQAVAYSIKNGLI